MVETSAGSIKVRGGKNQSGASGLIPARKFGPASPLRRNSPGQLPIAELHIYQAHPPDKALEFGCALQPKTYKISSTSISTPTHPLPLSRPLGAHLVTMASEDHKSKKDKKEKKEKKLSTDRVDKKKDKKDKKADKEKLKQKVADSLDRQLQADAAQSVADDDDDHPGSDFETIKDAEITTNIVYFAVPLADAKGHKKVFKTIKKGESLFAGSPSGKTFARFLEHVC